MTNAEKYETKVWPNFQTTIKTEKFLRSPQQESEREKNERALYIENEKKKNDVEKLSSPLHEMFI